MGFEKPGQPIGDSANVASMTIVAVHDDPLAMAKLRDLLTNPLERRIQITDEAGKHADTGPCPHQIP
jgi:hypothetical protein